MADDRPLPVWLETLPRHTIRRLEDYMVEFIALADLRAAWQAQEETAPQHEKSLWERRFEVSEECRNNLAAALAKLQQAQEGGWQPIATALKDGRKVLLTPAFPNEPVVCGTWDCDPEHEAGQCWRDEELHERVEPTHWMNLPESPTRLRGVE